MKEFFPFTERNNFRLKKEKINSFLISKTENYFIGQKMQEISSKIGGYFSSKGYGWILEVEEEENDKPLL
jgi:hypothetical protein